MLDEFVQRIPHVAHVRDNLIEALTVVGYRQVGVSIVLKKRRELPEVHIEQIGQGAELLPRQTHVRLTKQFDNVGKFVTGAARAIDLQQERRVKLRMYSLSSRVLLSESLNSAKSLTGISCSRSMILKL